jgi:predicted nuclease with RNAse H fold
MRTIGVDLSSQDANTALCAIDWNSGRAKVSAGVVGISDADLRAAILATDAHAIGIDVPFGWPAAFPSALSSYAAGEWPSHLRPADLRYRATDRYVRERTGLCPLSVSADRIAMPAMRAAALFCATAGIDIRAVRSAPEARVVEVYPAAALRRWTIPSAGYKKRDAGGVAARRRILATLQDQLVLHFEAVASEVFFAASDHALDALLSAVVARCHRLGLTDSPPEDVRPLLSVEGWIALPMGTALERLVAHSPHQADFV